MSNRDLSLAARVEAVREQHDVAPVIEFDLIDIKERFDKNIESIRGQFNVADKLFSEGNVEECENIWRSQIVFLESALDFYIHEISKYGMINIFKKNWAKTEKYNNYLIPMKYVEDGIRNPQSQTWFLNYLNDRISTEVYLSANSMKDQLNLLGINFGPVMSRAFPKPNGDEASINEGKKVIKELFERRNQIAHQADRHHNDATRNDITKEYVEQCIANVISIVDSIQGIALSKSSAE